MDTAKAANVIFTHGGRCATGRASTSLPATTTASAAPAARPVAAIPTTAGTGSEASPAAVIKDPAGTSSSRSSTPRSSTTSRSSTRAPPRFRPDRGRHGHGRADPRDRGVHSSEWNPHIDAYALHAIRLIRENLERAVADTADEEARGQHARRREPGDRPDGLGATGIAHSLSHPCGARYGVPHGVANAIHLPVTIEFNAAGPDEYADRYRTICEILHVDAGGDGPAVGAALADRSGN